MPRYDELNDTPSGASPQQPVASPVQSRPMPSSPYRPYNDFGYPPRYDDRYASRYGSVLSEVETQSNPESKPVTEEHWFSGHWRPAMAWLYFGICAFDFIAAPIFTFWFYYFTKQPYVPWEPLTLHGGGLIHVSLGAIIGIYTWSRTREKLASMAEVGSTRGML